MAYILSTIFEKKKIKTFEIEIVTSLFLSFCIFLLTIDLHVLNSFFFLYCQMRHMLISPKHWPSDILMEILTIDHDHNGSWSMDIVNNTYTCIYNTMYFLGLKTPPTLTLNPSCQDQILASFRGPLASISLSFKWRPLQHLSLYEHFLIYSRLSSLFLVCPVNCVCVRDDSTKSWILDAREKRSLFFFFFFFWSGWILGISAVSEKQLHWK